MNTEQKLLEALKNIVADAEDYTRRTGKIVSWSDKCRALIEEVEASQKSEVEPVAWMNPLNKAVIDKQKKKQIGLGNGYPNFSVPLYPVPPTEAAIREMALRKAMREVREFLWASPLSENEVSQLCGNIEALIPQPCALEDICMAVSNETIDWVGFDHDGPIFPIAEEQQELVKKVIAEWQRG